MPGPAHFLCPEVAEGPHLPKLGHSGRWHSTQTGVHSLPEGARWSLLAGNGRHGMDRPPPPTGGHIHPSRKGPPF